MSNTITNLIETINVNFPVAGKSNDSQGFRDNFNIIQQSLLLTQGEIDTIQNSLVQSNSALNVSVSHVNGQVDLTVGQQPYQSSLSLNANNDLVITSAGNIIVKPNTGVPIIALGAYALTDSVTNISTGTFAVDNVRNISTGSTIVFPLIGGTYTVSKIDYANNWITVTPPIPDYPQPFHVGDVLTFILPFTPSNDGTELIVQGTVNAVSIDLNGTLLSNITGTGSVVLSDSPSLIGVPTAPTAPAGTNSTQIATTEFAMKAAYPVGSVYMNASNGTNPGTLLGFGTWVSLGAGRMLVGFSSGDPLFGQAGNTGGSRDATLPTHSHTDDAVNITGTFYAANRPEISPTGVFSFTGATSDSSLTGGGLTGDVKQYLFNSTHSHTINSAGSSATDANLPPYITVYMWQRTA